ncbi:DUF4330 family protein [Haloplanus litoreus]|uniref:DUF4330 family protein n=1 Tax=Haloplanus litoreus TaxID=767515 RepID=UPI0036D20D31
MDLIDDEGNLFGLLNIVDAFFVVVLLVAVAGGFVFVSGSLSSSSSSEQLPSKYATIDLGPQPDYLVSEFEVNDTYSPETHSRLTVTDIHLSPQGEQTRVLLRTKIQGPAAGGTISYDGAPLRLGRTLTIQTDTYSVSGAVQGVGDTESFDDGDTRVLLRGRISATNATALTGDDEIRIGNRRVAAVEDVIMYDADDADSRITYVAATLNTYDIAGSPHFGGTRIRQGSGIDLPSTAGPLSMTVVARDAPTEVTTTEVVVQTSATSEVAESIETGDRYRVGGREVASVATVSVYGTEDPDRKRVFVGLSLEAVVQEQRLRFGGSPIREGTNISFETDEYALTGDVRRVGATEQRGHPATRAVTLQLENAGPQLANAVHEGMTETAAGRTIARIQSIERTSEKVILTSQDGNIYLRDHPTEQELALHTRLTVRETGAGVTFKGRAIEHGSTVVLDLGSVTLRVTVVDIGA